MYKVKQTRVAAILFAIALPLSGCATDNYFDDEAFEPYGGSKQYPITVVNGKAHVKPCGNWPKNLADTSDNDIPYNHGCAVQSNIAAMAAYPADLVGQGHRLPSPNGDIVYTAIDKTRTAMDGSAGGGGGAAGGGAAGGTP